MKQEAGKKFMLVNKKARHEYNIIEKYEAGIVLKGTEVKSLRRNGVNFLDSFASIRDGEAWLHSLHISPYSHGNRENHEPARKRKLLLHAREILKLSRKIKEKGLTLIPLSIYLKQGYIKIEIGLCRGKNIHDKRRTLEKKQANRDMERAIRDKF